MFWEWRLGWYQAELGFVQAAVGAAGGEQFVVAALFGDAVGVDDDDAVGLLDGGEAVGDDQGGAAAGEFGEGLLDGALGFAVEG